MIWAACERAAGCPRRMVLRPCLRRKSGVLPPARRAAGGRLIEICRPCSAPRPGNVDVARRSTVGPANLRRGCTMARIDTTAGSVRFLGFDVGKSSHWACGVDAQGCVAISERVGNRAAAIDVLLARAGGRPWSSSTRSATSGRLCLSGPGRPAVGRPVRRRGERYGIRGDGGDSHEDARRRPTSPPGTPRSPSSRRSSSRCSGRTRSEGACSQCWASAPRRRRRSWPA